MAPMERIELPYGDFIQSINQGAHLFNQGLLPLLVILTILATSLTQPNLLKSILASITLFTLMAISCNLSISFCLAIIFLSSIVLPRLNVFSNNQGHHLFIHLLPLDCPVILFTCSDQPNLVKSILESIILFSY